MQITIPYLLFTSKLWCYKRHQNHKWPDGCCHYERANAGKWIIFSKALFYLPSRDHFNSVWRCFNPMTTVFIQKPLVTWIFLKVIKNWGINLLSSKALRVRWRCYSSVLRLFSSLNDLILFVQYTLLGKYGEHSNISVSGSSRENFSL